MSFPSGETKDQPLSQTKLEKKIEEDVREKLDKPLVADLQSSSDLSHPSKARDNNGEI